MHTITRILLLFSLAVVPFLPCILCAGVISWMLRSIDVNEAMPNDVARAKLASILAGYFDMSLENAGRVVAAHEQRDGFHGEGSLWFLVKMNPGSLEKFEGELLDHIRADPRTRKLKLVSPLVQTSSASQPNWWHPESLTDALALEVEHKTPFFFVFSQKASKLYVRQDLR